jgi:hypothetical protein
VEKKEIETLGLGGGRMGCAQRAGTNWVSGIRDDTDATDPAVDERTWLLRLYTRDYREWRRVHAKT